MDLRQLLELTQSFEILANGTKYPLVDGKQWDIKKNSNRLDNGNSNVHGLQGLPYGSPGSANCEVQMSELKL